MAFGKRLEMTLEEIDMSVAQLARNSGIAPTTIYSLISRDSDNVGYDKVKKIEAAIGATPGSSRYCLLHGIPLDSDTDLFRNSPEVKWLVRCGLRLKECVLNGKEGFIFSLNHEDYAYFLDKEQWHILMNTLRIITCDLIPSLGLYQREEAERSFSNLDYYVDDSDNKK